MCFLFVVTNVYAQSVLVNDTGVYGGYGEDYWGNMSTLMDTATNNNVSVVSDFSNLSQMLSYDALWLDNQGTTASLTATELSNISTFINTGRRVVMIGENTTWNAWNTQLMGIVGGANSGAYGGTATSVYAHDITQDATTVYIPVGGIVVSGGTALYDHNFATLWGDGLNVLTVLDYSIFGNTFSSYNDNSQFQINVANWVANSNAVPEPTTMLLLGSGLIGLAGFRRKNKKA